jgi:hypothetical protein
MAALDKLGTLAIVSSGSTVHRISFSAEHSGVGDLDPVVLDTSGRCFL